MTNNLSNQNQTQTSQILATFGEEEIELSNSTQRNLVLEKGKKLQSFTKRNQNIHHINHSIYHLLLDPFTLNNAYSNLSKNKGSLTDGYTPGNIQGYSRNETQQIIEKLKTEQYSPTPVRRVWVPKPGKTTKRPLGIPTFQDRVVQEALRGLLEAIYEPEFRAFSTKNPKVNNFGFRPNLGCWDAIQHFTSQGQGATFVIEGDIKGAYDNVSFPILLNILSRRIKDKKIIRLIEKFLKAGIMDQGKYEHSILGGVFSGGILSPLLFNIYMFEFDKYVQTLIDKHNTTKTKNKSPQYQINLYRKKIAQIQYKNLLSQEEKNKIKIQRAKKNLINNTKTLLETPSYDRSSEIQINYTRYADDWLIGIAGNYNFAENIKADLEGWIEKNLKLSLSQEKTKITNIRKDHVPFLGYYIHLRSKNRFTKIGKIRTKKSNGLWSLVTRRTTSSKYRVTPNTEKLKNKITLIGIAKPGTLFPIGKRAWAALDEFQIVQKYHSMFLGLVGHYIKCDSHKFLYRLSYIFQYSCAKTIATRKRITMAQVFKKYGNNLEITKYIKDSKPRKIEFMGLKDIKQKYFSENIPQTLNPDFDPFKIRTFWRTTFKLYSICCICGSNSNIEMHHIKSIKSIKNKTQDFNLILKQLNRKQVPVCHSCHTTITSGTYSGKSIKDLFSESLAKM